MASQTARRRMLQQEQAVSLYLAGATAQQVATALGWSVDRVWRAVRQAMDYYTRRNADDLAELRAVEVARLDTLQRAHWAAALSGDSDSTRAVLQIIDRRIKLLGIDPPQRLDVSVSTELDEELARLVADLQAMQPEVIDVEVVSSDDEQPALEQTA